MSKTILTCLCLISSVLANSVGAAVSYWDPEGTATATAANLAGTWDTTSSDWSASSTQTASLSAWATTNAACFCAGGTAPAGAFTVMVNSTITCTGVFNGNLGPPGFNLTLAGTGALNFNNGAGPGNADGFGDSGSDGDPLIINIPLTGPTALAFEVANQVYLNVSNSYTGGSILGYVGSGSLDGIIDFTNGSFGTGGIYFYESLGGALVVLGQAAVTIPNGVTNWQASNGLSLNIVGNAAGVTFSGPWNLTGGLYGAASTNAQLNLGSGGANTNLVTISGKISGTNGFNKYGVGMLELTGANTYGTAGTALGSTWISNGWVVVANTTGSATGVSSVIITNSASPVGTGTLTGNGKISGSVTNYGNISATNMAGGCAALATGAETWEPGSSYIWAANNVSGTAGSTSGWDEIIITNSFKVASTFSIDVTSLTSANKQGALATFNNATNYSWPILVASNGITGFSAANVTINTTGFANALGNGRFAVSTNGNTMYLNFLQPPTVTESPGYFTVASGNKAIFNAAATSTQLTYQWQLNGGALNTPDIVGGQTNSSLTISPANDADAGTYTVTVSNPLGSVTASSYLVVVDTPMFSGTPGAGNFTMNFSGPVGKNYRIWSSTNLTVPVLTDWNPVSFGQTFTSGVNTFTDTSATYPAEYYCITVP